MGTFPAVYGFRVLIESWVALASMWRDYRKMVEMVKIMKCAQCMSIWRPCVLHEEVCRNGEKNEMEESSGI